MEYDTDQCTDEQLKDATRYILIRKLTHSSSKFNQKYRNDSMIFWLYLQNRLQKQSVHLSIDNFAASPATVTTCPFSGLHRMLTPNGRCEGYVQSGCNGSSSIDVIDPCSKKTVVQLECLKVWGGGKKTFVIASGLGRTAGVANCFVSISSG